MENEYVENAITKNIPFNLISPADLIDFPAKIKNVIKDEKRKNIRLNRINGLYFAENVLSKYPIKFTLSIIRKAKNSISQIITIIA